VTQYSVTAGCTAVDTVNELGAVGDCCWLQDAMVNAASEKTMNGAITLGEVSDIWLLLRTEVLHAHQFRPHP
jgi:hypothetical protein